MTHADLPGAAGGPGPDPGYPAPPPAAPGHGPPPPPGYAAPGYAAPGYPPAGYAAPGYAAPGYPPAYGSPAYSSPAHGYGPAGGQAVVAPNGLPLAGWGARVGAYLIDALVVSVALTVIAVPLFAIFLGLNADTMSDPSPDSDAAVGVFAGWLAVNLGLFVAAMAAYYLYFAELMWRSGQTLGKKALGLRVVMLDPAAPLTRRAAALRWLVQFVAAAVVPFGNLVDALWPLWDTPWRQSLHDKAARTVVVRVRP